MDSLRRRVESGAGFPPGAIKKGEPAPAEAVLFSNGSLTFLAEEANWPDPSLGYFPIGYVVVPGSENKYGDGSNGIIAFTRIN